MSGFHHINLPGKERCPIKYIYTREEVAGALRSPWLTDRQRLVCDLYYRRGWRIEDVAAELGVARSTVSRDLAKIRGTMARN